MSNLYLHFHHDVLHHENPFNCEFLVSGSPGIHRQFFIKKTKAGLNLSLNVDFYHGNTMHEAISYVTEMASTTLASAHKTLAIP